MTKVWKKIGDSTYTLFQNNDLVGQMEIILNSLERKAIAKIASNMFTIRRTGFWKNSLVVLDDSDQIIMKVYPEKWYSSTSLVEYENKKYKLVLRNNPLAEYAILDNEKVIMSYGIDNENEKMCIRIASSGMEQDYMFDLLLWYLFVPMVTENNEDEFAFMLLITAQ